MYSNIQMQLAYLESELGCVLTIDATGLVYGAKKAIDGTSVVTGNALAAHGIRCAAVDPQITKHTGAPVDAVFPAITGDPTLATHVLTCSTGTWTKGSEAGALTYTYQWKNDTVNIGAATASTYTLVSGDMGHAITCLVTATDAAGDATSHLSNVVQAGAPPVNTVAPAITGTPNSGEVLTTTNGTWTGAATITFARVWQKDGVTIAAQTALTYTIVAGDVGHNITCIVTATNNVSSVAQVSNTVAVS